MPWTVQSVKPQPERTKSRGSLLLLALLAATVSACAPRLARPPVPAAYEGMASWYGQDFHGRTTSSGERYNMYGLTAAHKELPLGTTVRVTRLDNGMSVVVRVNDRGPFIEGRIIDLSYEAARRVDMIRKGVARVRVDVLSVPPGSAPLPAAPPAPAPAGGSPAPATAAAPLWISLGTFGLEGNASWLRNRLAGDFPTVTITPLERDGRTLYQLRLGPAVSVEEAEVMLQRVRELGLRGTILKQE